MIKRWGLRSSALRPAKHGEFVSYADYVAHVRILHVAIAHAKRLQAAADGWRAAANAKLLAEADNYQKQIEVIHACVQDALAATSLLEGEG